MVHEHMMSGRSFSLHEGALEALSTPILIHDHRRILFANWAALAMLGARERSQIVGRPLAEIVHRDGVQAGETRRKIVLEDGHPVTEVPVKLVGADGVVRYATANGLPIILDDGTRAVLVTAVLNRTGSPVGNAETTLPE